MRDHIEFVQAQRLPWQDGAGVGLPGRQVKLLSGDRDTGAFSAMVRIRRDGGGRTARSPPTRSSMCWTEAADRRPRAMGRTATRSCRRDMRAPGWTAPEGATVLSFFSARPSSGAVVQACEDRLVRKIDLTDGVWDGEFERFGLASMNNRARMRVLRDDPATGENTYITATTPFRHGERAERHPVVQEFFLLAGELAGNTGTMQAGAYCFRPKMVAHGPYGSRTGGADPVPLAGRRAGDVHGRMRRPSRSRRRMRPSFRLRWRRWGIRCRVRLATEPGFEQFGRLRPHRPAAAPGRRRRPARPLAAATPANISSSR